MLKTILSITILLFLVASFQAKDPEPGKDSVLTYNLADVVITANKTLTPLLEVASSISVITKDDIEKKNKHYLSDILRSEVGLSVAQQGGLGKLTRIFLRGANPHHTLFIIDGVEMNNPGSLSNAYDLSSLPTDNIERIEILRGPQSTLYGSDALAGVVSIFTNKGNGKTRFTLDGEAGSYKSFKGRAGINGSLGSLHYVADFSRLQTDGISSASKEYGNSENDFSNVSSANVRVGYDFTDYLNVDLINSFTKSKAGLDQNEKIGDDPNFEYAAEEVKSKVSAGLNLFDGFWYQELSASLMKAINKTTDAVDQLHANMASENYFIGKRTKLEWQNIFTINKNLSAQFGFDSEKESAYSSYSGLSQWGSFSSEIPFSSFTTSGFYVQGQAKYFNTIFASAGVRYDDNTLFGSQVTYRIAPAFFLNLTSTKVKASFGTGFKSPSLYYLMDPIYGNKDLKAEKSKGWDAGIEQYIFSNKIVIGVTYYNNNFTNLIGYDANFKTVNIDKAETKGIEFSLAVNPVEHFTVNANYTNSSNKDKSEGKSESGLDLIRRPRHKGAVSFNYNIYDANINVESVFTGKREDKEFMPDYTTRRVDLRAYTLVNLSVSYDILKHIKLLARVENLLNEKYEEVLFYGTAGTSVYAGFKVNL